VKGLHNGHGHDDYWQACCKGPTTRTEGLALQTTIPTLATPKTQSHTVGASAPSALSNTTEQSSDATRLPWVPQAIQTELYQRRNRISLVGNYLSVLDTQMWNDPRDIVERATTLHNCVREAYHWVTKTEPDTLMIHCKRAPPVIKQQKTAYLQCTKLREIKSVCRRKVIIRTRSHGRV
jgi:hypothetical protein